METASKIETEGEKMDSGASRHGNFCNYYSFHPADERIQQLPRGLWCSSHEDKKFIALDIGCNVGDLTLALHDFLKSEQTEDREIAILGIDLDEILIKRANEKNTYPKKVTFQCLDFFSENRDDKLKSYLTSFERNRFDVVFAFSITMWIHLNHGDTGLKDFLQIICAMTDMVVIEPQLWKCYRNASRRLRRANKEDFPLLEKLHNKKNVEKYIENILQNDCNFKRVSVTEANDWQRKILIYKRDLSKLN